MGTHLPQASPASLGSALRLFTEFIKRGGWVGVDMFFVLSGFLVSGLIFQEFQRTGGVAVRRFLVRRGFKIYPAYYALLSATVIAILWGKYLIPLRWVGYSAVFAANYLPAAWDHLWTLSVEEHFYFALAALTAWELRSGRRGEPFRSLPIVVGALVALCLTGRILTSNAHPTEWWLVREPTHLRIDSLGIGVLLAYVKFFRLNLWLRVIRRRRILLCTGFAALLPPFFVEYDIIRPVYGAAFLLYALGSAALITGVHGSHKTASLPARMFAWVGRRSYSLYLWHLPMQLVATRLIQIEHDWVMFVIVYVLLSFGAGLVSWICIEEPAIRLRDGLQTRLVRSGT